MAKIAIFSALFGLYLLYSFTVYTKGTDNNITVSATERLKINYGKQVFQQYNCIACHQLYGLGGYLGPELTTAFSDSNRGEMYMKTFLKGGGQRMPNFHFSDDEISTIISYLKYIDETAVTYKTP